MTPRRGVAWVLTMLLVVITFGLVAVACGDDGDAEAPAQAQAQQTQGQAQEQTEPAGAALSGAVAIDGSSTVFPISEAMAEEFQLEHSGVQVTVGVSGTGGGFERFCNGETDISNASRPIKESEAEICAANGVGFVEVPIAFDGLTVVVNPANDWVDQLTVAELNHIFRPEGFATSWAEVREGFPDTPIAIYSPGADSGTFDYFTEVVNEENGAQRSADTTFSEDDNVLVIGVQGEEGAIGYFGLSYYENNRDALKAVAIVNADDEAVLPSAESVNDGSYNPLARPLFIYVNTSALERPEVAAFVEFNLTDGRPLIDSPEVGYVQLPEQLYPAVLARVQDRVTGSPVVDAGEFRLGLYTGEEEPAAAMAELSGNIQIDGSSTVFPISEAMAEEFQLAHPDVRVTVGVSGTGGGFERFCNGETDVSNASRPIKESEAELCAANGVDFVEVPVAFDGLTVVVNPANDWVDQLTVAELNRIFRPEGFATSWAEVREGFPETPIAIYSPGADSGTFDYFTEAVNEENGAQRSANTTFSEDDNVLVIGVQGDQGAIGYFGLSYYENNRDTLKAVAVVNADGNAILPSGETVNDGTYNPLSRPLFIYVTTSALARPDVAAFVEFNLTDGRPLIDSPEVGYVQLPEASYGSILSRVQNGVTGSPVIAGGGVFSLSDY